MFPRLTNDFWSFWNAWTKLRKSKRRSLPHLFYSDGPTDCLFAALCFFRWALKCSRFASRHAFVYAGEALLVRLSPLPGFLCSLCLLLGSLRIGSPPYTHAGGGLALLSALRVSSPFVMLTHYTSASFLCAPQYPSTRTTPTVCNLRAVMLEQSGRSFLHMGRVGGLLGCFRDILLVRLSDYLAIHALGSCAPAETVGL